MATRLLNTAKRKTEKERLSMPPQMEKASQVLARAAKVMFAEPEPVEEHGTDLDWPRCGRCWRNSPRALP